jgi:hypothetical protein
LNFFQKGKGKGNALRQGFINQFTTDKVIVIMDADGSMSPTEIPSFVAALDSGSDLVKGSRFLSSGYTKDMNLI